MSFVENADSTIRLSVFLIVFLAMAAWEYRWRLRAPMPHKISRMRVNITLLIVNVVVLRLLLPAGIVGIAVYADATGIGLLNAIKLPFALVLLITIMTLDLAMYLQHILFHWSSVLWRLHRVHHSDVDLDLTTGLRFHVLEILLSTAFKSVLILAMGFPAAGVFVFEIILNSASIFNHSNARIADPYEGALRRIVVTPAMHWVHHSIEPRESQHNFGFSLSWWDRLFGTYLDAPAAGIERMECGISGYQGKTTRGLLSLISQPWTTPQTESQTRYEIRAR